MLSSSGMHVVVGRRPTCFAVELTGLLCLFHMLLQPHPEIFATAAAAFQTPPAGPQHCLVFEDAPSGVQAALAAGMHVVMVPDPNLDRSLCREATQVLDSLEAFKPEDWGLPPYQQ